jgi:hypothetical protein
MTTVLTLTCNVCIQYGQEFANAIFSVNCVYPIKKNNTNANIGDKYCLIVKVDVLG